MKIAVIGTGYVGLVSGSCFAELGIETWCIDKDASKIDALKRGHIPIYEADLDEIVISNHEQGSLHFTTSIAEAVPQADVVVLAVGTPEHEDGSVNLDYVFAAGREVAEHLDGFTVVVTKSTVPVGTSRALYKAMREANPNADFETASNPEFLREGQAVKDFMGPDRIVFGTASERSEKVLRRLYRPLELAGVAVEATNPETAELTKYASNSFLATKIAFINQVSDLCEAVDADVTQVGRAMGLDTRIGGKFLQPGPGFGGSCFPKDTKGYAQMGQEAGSPQTIVEAVVAANESRKDGLAEAVRRASEGRLAGKRVAVLGLTFKPDTDDVRESPALKLLPALASECQEVRAHDPRGIPMTRAALGDWPIRYCEDLWECMDAADTIVVVTQWSEYRDLDWSLVASRMNGKSVVDFWNIYDPQAVTDAGLEYHSIGRRPVSASEAAGMSVAAE